jgi:transcriptional regulator GlxA family with amidase domain
MHPVKIVSEILEKCFQKNQFTISIESLAAQYKISSRTLQRYFEMCTGISSKQALQVMRFEKRHLIWLIHHLISTIPSIITMITAIFTNT